MRSVSRHRSRQQGAVLITVAMLLLFLLGFMGFALDFGRLFIVKTELQTAMDSCALAAAQELDGQANSIIRAGSAGNTARNLNRVNMQSPTWSSQMPSPDAGISYRDVNYNPTTNPVLAKYAQCDHVQPSIRMWLLQIFGAMSGDTTTHPGARSVAASAVATRTSAQTTCPIPVALKPNVGGTAPDYGFVPGQWVTLLVGPGGATNGQAGWANLNGSSSAADTVTEMNGYCGTRVDDDLGTPGQQANVTDIWNYRFGIYRQNGDPSHAGTPGDPQDHNQRPDYTGFVYTTATWPSRFNAYSDYQARRVANAACAGSVSACETLTGLSFQGFNKIAPGGNVDGGHRQYGQKRRLVIVPVASSSNTVADYACMLLLQPLSSPAQPSVELEYLGNAGATGSPCTTAGLPGGAAGPLVPVLIR